MKKVLVVILLLCVVLTLDACKAKEPDSGKSGENANQTVNNRNANTNTDTSASTNANANANQGGNVNTDQGLAPSGRSNNEKDVQILINEVGGKCTIEVPAAYQSVYIKVNKGKVKWTVINNCAAAAASNVIIENFGKSNQRPFGGEECDNRFVFDPIARGEESRMVTRTGKVEGRFAYTIKVVNANGTLAELDPEIIVGSVDSDQQ
ncbi:MAG TPA: hypothetical protein VGV59_14890 [Pyrinomonadaceae bacterium]|nr:hypothetical protein [Pyrinomonadaceae bacterium]